MRQIINISSKAEIKAAIVSTRFGSYNYFEGDIRNGKRYARINYSYSRGNKLDILVTYWEDGQEVAVDFASHCSTANGVANKVARFLNVR